MKQKFSNAAPFHHQQFRNSADTGGRAEGSAERKDDQWYTTLFAHNRNPITIIDTHGNYLEANQAFLDFVDMDRKTLLSMNVVDFLLPQAAEKAFDKHKDLWRRGGVLETGYIVNGQKKFLELSITPITYKGREAAMEIVQDITERRRIEEELRQSEENYRLLVENQKDLVVSNPLPRYCSAPESR